MRDISQQKKRMFLKEKEMGFSSEDKYDVKDFLHQYIYETYIKPIPKELASIREKVSELKNMYSMASNLIISYGEMMGKSEIEMKC